MISESVVDLSRLQFAMTAMYHFIFVPLTLGLAFLLAIMESVYVMTGKQVYKDMTKFWGKLFGINFALGVTTGLTMEFQFGTNWAYYSHYVGDIFGAPLAIEGLMAFFLESTFIGLFFFGWDRLSKVQHLAVTWLVALGSNLSALWILIANGWMQNPVGSEFNFETMRMELVDFGALLFNPVAQVKFVHTVSAGYVTGAIFVLAISSYYLLKKRDLGFARRSFAIAAVFGLASTISVFFFKQKTAYEIHLSSGLKVVLEAGSELTFKAAGSFIKLDAGGITMVGPLIKMNSGGSPGKGSGAAPVLPGKVKAADADKAGQLLIQAQKQALQQAARTALPICEICQQLEAKV